MKPDMPKKQGGNIRNTRTTHPNPARRRAGAQERCAATGHRVMTVRGEDGREKPAEEPQTAIKDGRCGKCGAQIAQRAA